MLAITIDDDIIYVKVVADCEPKLVFGLPAAAICLVTDRIVTNSPAYEGCIPTCKTCWQNGHTEHTRSDDNMSQMLTQLESQPEFGSGSESGGCGDDESGDDEDGSEDDEDEEDADS
nr:hypothetical protein [Tanacetum cinerariifolium]